MTERFNTILAIDGGVLVRDDDSDITISAYAGITFIMASGRTFHCDECSENHIAMLLDNKGRLALACELAPPGYVVVPADDVIADRRRRPTIVF